MKIISICCTLFAISILTSVATFAQVNEEQLKNWLGLYLETGDITYRNSISENAPGTKYDDFCKAWQLLDADNKSGMDLARQMVREYPDWPESWFAAGTFYVNGFKKYDSAVICLDKAISLNPEFKEAYFNRGIARLNLKEYEKAFDDFGQVLDLDRSFASAYVLRAVSNFYLGNYGDIVDDIEIALQMDPYVIADLYYFQVRKTIDKAIEIAPENVNLYYGRGYANFVNGYYRLAVNDFARALELVPGNAEFYKFSGASKTWIKDIPGAESDLKLAMGINPDDPEIYYYLGILYNDVADQPSMGYEYFSTAIEQDPLAPDYFYERAWCLYKLSDYEVALEDLKQALEMNSIKGDYYVLRGYLALYGKLDTGSDYCEDFRKAEELGTIFKLKNLLKKNCE